MTDPESIVYEDVGGGRFVCSYNFAVVRDLRGEYYPDSLTIHSQTLQIANCTVKAVNFRVFSRVDVEGM